MKGVCTYLKQLRMAAVYPSSSFSLVWRCGGGDEIVKKRGSKSYPSIVLPSRRCRCRWCQYSWHRRGTYDIGLAAEAAGATYLIGGSLAIALPCLMQPALVVVVQ